MVKQIIVVRKDIVSKMGPGKLSAQVSHASLAPLLQIMRGGIPYEIVVPSEENLRLFVDLEIGTPLKDWIDGQFRKIILSVKNEEQLLKKYNEIKEAGFVVSLIKDAGYTVFDKPTITCFGIEPLRSQDIDPFTKKLQLLK